MQTERGKLFDEKEPDLSDDEVSKAYEDGKIAASFKGKPVVTSPENIGFIALVITHGVGQVLKQTVPLRAFLMA
jgi:hypothetical protein